VMLMNLNAETEPVKNHRLQLIGVVSGGLLLLVLLSAVMKTKANLPVQMVVGEEGLIQNLGKTLFTYYVVPFELSSILFLSAMVGAVVISKKD